MNSIELEKIQLDKIKNIPNELYYFGENNIIQIVLHLTMIYYNKNINKIFDRIDVYKIFDNYIVDETYPFIQYQTTNKKIIFKIYDKMNEIVDINTSYKWFESAPYDINIKIKTHTTSFISINIIASGRVEIKYQWLENEKASLKDLYIILK